MVASNRVECIFETLKWEGGYTNHPSDPGGPTNWGITIHDYRMYINKKGTAADVKAMTKDQAIKIYTEKYWKNAYYDCDKLPAGIDFSVYDFGVNSGPSRAKKFLDKASGGTSVETITRLNDARLAWLKTLSTWPVFGTGWGRRVKGVKAKSLEMANRTPSRAPEMTTGAVILGAGTWMTLGWKIALGVAVVAAIGVLGYYLYKRGKNVKKASK